MLLIPLLRFMFGHPDWKEHAANSTKPGTSPFLIGTLDFIFSLVIIFTFVANLLVIITITRTKSLQTVTNMYLVSLAVADMGVAILVMPFGVDAALKNRNWDLTSNVCRIYQSSDAWFCMASVYNLCAIAFDRFEAVHRPIEYAKGNRKLKTIIIIVILWSFAACFATILQFLNNWPDWFCYVEANYYLLLWSLLTFDFPLITLSLLNIKIYFTIKKSLRAMTRSDSRALQEAIKKEKRISIIMAIVIGAFVICWFPIKIIDVLAVLYCPTYGCNIPAALSSAALLFAYANSALNPVIYTIFNREFRRGLTELLCGWRTVQGDESTSSRYAVQSKETTSQNYSEVRYTSSDGDDGVRSVSFNAQT